MGPFNYQPNSAQGQQLNFGNGLNYEQMLMLQHQQTQQPQLNYSQLTQNQSQGGSGLDPNQLFQMIQKLKSGVSGDMQNLPALSGIQGLMGGASGAIPSTENGGASFGLGGSLVGGSGEVGSSTFAPMSIQDAQAGGGMWGSLANIIMGKK